MGTGTGVLSALASADIGRIRRAAGCGTTRAVSIVAACELARRIAAEKSQTISTISSKEDVERLFAPLAELGHEEFWVLYLTSGGRVIDRARLSQGGVAGTVVDHKLVVKRAVELRASSLILVHNHPSGRALPSRDDVSITETVRTAAALFDINVVDHVIISRSGSYSFAEHGRNADGGF
jgi:DNA repair protein RadC